MQRRTFIALMSGAAALPMVARGQDRVRRVGALITTQTAKTVLERVLAQLGWTLGRNLQIEYRMTGGDTSGRDKGPVNYLPENQT